MKTKNLLLGLAAILLSSSAFALSYTYNSAGAGQMSSATVAAYTTIDTLVVTGNIDARDFKFMRDQMPVLAALNLWNAEVVRYYGNAGTVDDEYSYSENQIPTNAFYNGSAGKTTLTDVVLPQGITEFSENAFYQCTNLEHITLPPNLSSISGWNSLVTDASTFYTVLRTNPPSVWVPFYVMTTPAGLIVPDGTAGNFNSDPWYYVTPTEGDYLVTADVGSSLADGTPLGTARVAEGKLYAAADNAVLTATPKSYATFVKWTDGYGDSVSIDNPLTVTGFATNSAYTANFDLNTGALGTDTLRFTHVGNVNGELYAAEGTLVAVYYSVPSSSWDDVQYYEGKGANTSINFGSSGWDTTYVTIVGTGITGLNVWSSQSDYAIALDASKAPHLRRLDISGNKFSIDDLYALLSVADTFSFGMQTIALPATALETPVQLANAADIAGNPITFDVKKYGANAASGTDYTLTGSSITFKTAGVYTVTLSHPAVKSAYDNNALAQVQYTVTAGTPAVQVITFTTTENYVYGNVAASGDYRVIWEDGDTTDNSFNKFYGTTTLHTITVTGAAPAVNFTDFGVYNTIDSIDVSGALGLRDLVINNGTNQTTLDLSRNTALENIYVPSAGNLTDVVVSSNNVSLQNVNIPTDLLSFTSLYNISHLPALTSWNFSDRQLQAQQNVWINETEINVPANLPTVAGVATAGRYTVTKDGSVAVSNTDYSVTSGKIKFLKAGEYRINLVHPDVLQNQNEDAEMFAQYYPYDAKSKEEQSITLTFTGTQLSNGYIDANGNYKVYADDVFLTTVSGQQYFWNLPSFGTDTVHTVSVVGDTGVVFTQLSGASYNKLTNVAVVQPTGGLQLLDVSQNQLSLENLYALSQAGIPSFNFYNQTLPVQRLAVNDEVNLSTLGGKPVSATVTGGAYTIAGGKIKFTAEGIYNVTYTHPDVKEQNDEGASLAQVRGTYIVGNPQPQKITFTLPHKASTSLYLRVTASAGRSYKVIWDGIDTVLQGGSGYPDNIYPTYSGGRDTVYNVTLVGDSIDCLFTTFEAYNGTVLTALDVSGAPALQDLNVANNQLGLQDLYAARQVPQYSFGTQTHPLVNLAAGAAVAASTLSPATIGGRDVTYAVTGGAAGTDYTFAGGVITFNTAGIYTVTLTHPDVKSSSGYSNLAQVKYTYIVGNPQPQRITFTLQGKAGESTYFHLTAAAGKTYKVIWNGADTTEEMGSGSMNNIYANNWNPNPRDTVYNVTLVGDSIDCIFSSLEISNQGATAINVSGASALQSANVSGNALSLAQLYAVAQQVPSYYFGMQTPQANYQSVAKDVAVSVATAAVGGTPVTLSVSKLGGDAAAEVDYVVAGNSVTFKTDGFYTVSASNDNVLYSSGYADLAEVQYKYVAGTPQPQEITFVSTSSNIGNLLIYVTDSLIVNWGDGNTNRYAAGSPVLPNHNYTDGAAQHTVAIATKTNTGYIDQFAVFYQNVTAIDISKAPLLQHLDAVSNNLSLADIATLSQVPNLFADLSDQRQLQVTTAAGVANVVDDVFGGLGTTIEVTKGGAAAVLGTDYTLSGGSITFLTASNNYEVTVSITGENASVRIPFKVSSKAAQTITWTQTLANGVYGVTAPITLTATASSALGVTYASSNPGVATVTGNVLTVVGYGNTTITANQSGNGDYLAATPIEKPFTVTDATRTNQTITWAAASLSAFVDDAFIVLGATTDATGLSVTYTSSNSGVAAIRHDTAFIVGGGTAVITASQAGNAAVNAAVDVNKTLTVNKRPQTIDWTQPVLTLPVALLSTDRIQLTATAASGLTVIYTLSNDSVARISSGYLVGEKVGTVTVTARQLGNGIYNAATDVSKTFTVIKGEQAILWEQDLVATSIGATITLQAEAYPSDLPVAYTSSDAAVATISGNTLTVAGYGTANITAASTGNANYNAPASVVKQITVLNPGKTNQNITWSQSLPNNATVLTAPIALTATTSASGLAITYVSDNAAVATVSGSTLTIVGIGVANIKAQQAGDAAYNPAAEVSKQLVVVKASQTITWSQTLTAVYGGAAITLDATAPAGAVTYTSSDAAVATVSGSTLTIVGVGTATITASQAGNANYNAAPNVNKTLTVSKADQTITWTQTLTAGVGSAPIALTAAASSALAVTYTSSNAAVATVSGSTLTIVGAGTATITASQAGNTNYNAAANVEKTLTVNNKTDQTITWSQTLTAVIGSAPITLNATAPAGAVTYTSSNPAVATVSGSTLTIVGEGTATITASQAGNATYNAAANVEKTLTVTAAPTSVASSTTAVLRVYPTVTNGQLSIDNLQLKIGDKVEIYNLSGTKVLELPLSIVHYPLSISIANLPAGTYIVKVGNKVAKIVKN